MCFLSYRFSLFMDCLSFSFFSVLLVFIVISFGQLWSWGEMTTLRSSWPSRLRQLLSSEGAIGPSVKLDSEPVSFFFLIFFCNLLHNLYLHCTVLIYFRLGFYWIDLWLVGWSVKVFLIILIICTDRKWTGASQVLELHIVNDVLFCC